jgi:hypothetical protein
MAGMKKWKDLFEFEDEIFEDGYFEDKFMETSFTTKR